MTDLNIFLALGLLLSVGLSAFGAYRLPEWKAREFGTYEFKWKTIFISSSLISFTVGILVYYLSLSPWPAIAIIPLAYMTVLGSVTDMKVVKIPSDISILSYWIPVPLLIIFADSYGWLSFAIWMAIVLLFTVFAFAGAFGFADLRIMILAGTSISWWVGAENILMAFGASALVQLLLHPLAHVFNWGIVKERKSISYLVKEKEEAEKLALLEDQASDATLSLEKPEPALSSIAEETNEIDKEPKIQEETKGKVNNFLNGKSAKAKRFVPFGPALCIAFCLVGLYYAKTFALYIAPHFGWWNP
jgi:prepilin signal peptidase PulO-like enzyme (type II secretory pathway)